MDSFISTFAATLFALMNSLGVMPVFLTCATKEPLGVQPFVTLLISLTVFGLLALLLFTGAALLRFFGIDTDSFPIAGVRSRFPVVGAASTETNVCSRLPKSPVLLAGSQCLWAHLGRVALPTRFLEVSHL
jgi:hypothetical protein